MDWEIARNTTYFSDTGQIDMDAPPQIGDEAKLWKGGHFFDVRIVGEEEGVFRGTVLRIGPEPLVEAEGVNRHDEVEFALDQISELTQR